MEPLAANQDETPRSGRKKKSAVARLAARKKVADDSSEIASTTG